MPKDAKDRDQQPSKEQPQKPQQNPAQQPKPIRKPVIVNAPKQSAPPVKQQNPNQQQIQRQHPQQQQQQQRRQDRFHPHDSQTVISVVVPAFNEEESLPELAMQLESELNKIVRNRWEVLFIDDGSTDKTFEVLKTLHQRNFRFKAIRLRRNEGKSAALATGFAESTGMVVVTMDADLQDDPAEIGNLLSKLKEGYDLVSGWKIKRKDPITKTIPSKFFNFVTSLASGIKLHDFNCGLKAYRREVVDSVKVYGEMHRYIPMLAKWEGYRITEIPVKHHARRYGKTKFGMSRFLKGFLDLISILFVTKYFKRPLHFFGTLGVLLAIAGFATDLYLAIEWFMGLTSLSNRPLALFGVALIIVGVQMISFGLLGEMIVKHSLEKTQYGIKERLK